VSREGGREGGQGLLDYYWKLGGEGRREGGRARSVVVWMMNRITMHVLSQTTVYAENITLEN